MITFSKMNPTIFDQSDLFDLGPILKTIGTRILLISSNRREDRDALDLIKQLFLKNSITFIEHNQDNKNLNEENLGTLIERAETFNIQVIFSLGSLPQRMAGRYVAQVVNLPYFEAITSYDNPFLLNPYSVIPNRVGDSYTVHSISPNILEGILLISKNVERMTHSEKVTHLIGSLVELSQIIICEKCDSYVIDEGKILMDRILHSIEDNKLNTKDLFHIGISVSRLTSLAHIEVRELTILPWIIANRFNVNLRLIKAKILPWILEEGNHVELANKCRDILSSYGVSGRLNDLNITLDQLFSIEMSERSSVILDNAY